MIWDPMFLGDIWSAQNLKTFELCLSVRQFAHRLLLPIRWLVLEMGYISAQDLVPPIKIHRYTGDLSTWNVRFTPNLIFRLICQLLISLPKIIFIGPQGRTPPILVKSVYWVLEDMEHPIHTKFNIYEWGGC